jgi:hypothetical protein
LPDEVAQLGLRLGCPGDPGSDVFSGDFLIDQHSVGLLDRLGGILAELACDLRVETKREHRLHILLVDEPIAHSGDTAALDAEPAARRTFDGLSYSNRSWHVLSINGAKTDETRQRRIAKSVEALREGRPR